MFEQVRTFLSSTPFHSVVSLLWTPQHNRKCQCTPFLLSCRSSSRRRLLTTARHSTSEIRRLGTFYSVVLYTTPQFQWISFDWRCRHRGFLFDASQINWFNIFLFHFKTKCSSVLCEREREKRKKKISIYSNSDARMRADSCVYSWQFARPVHFSMWIKKLHKCFALNVSIHNIIIIILLVDSDSNWMMKLLFAHHILQQQQPDTRTECNKLVFGVCMLPFTHR